eukprot:12612158-Ditylum_brightwellii.AAC.1
MSKRETKTAAAARESKSDNTSDLESEDKTLTLNRDTLDALAKTIATAVATAMTTAALTPYVMTHSSALDPYDTASFDMVTKEGKYQWAVMTKMQD